MSHIGSSFDDFLEGQGTRGETIAIASKRVLVWQLAQAMEEGNLTRDDMAARMGTTVVQIDGILDAEGDTVQLDTLHRAAAAAGGSCGSSSHRAAGKNAR